MRDPGAGTKTAAMTKDAAPGVGVKKAFTGGEQGFVSLLLSEVETINHNTKRFRFKLPEEGMVSGLTVASAVLTKFQAPGAEKPVVRPYTPTSDEGKWGARSGQVGRR